MTVKLYRFSKRINSTKRPSGGTEFNVVLKDACTVINPVLVFSGLTNPTNYNYAYIPDFDRYYYIGNWTAERNLWTASLNVDALASWKDTIGASTQYIGRSSAASNGNIRDNLYPTLASSFTANSGFSDRHWIINPVYGDFVLEVANILNSPVGTTYYITDYSGANWLVNQLFTSNLWEAWENWLAKPVENIVSFRWFPCNFPKSGLTATDEIYVGKIRLAASGHTFYRALVTSDPPFYRKTITTNRLGRTDQDRGNYLLCEPYSKYTAYLPPFGMVPLPGSSLVNNMSVSASVLVDPFSGIGILSVDAGQTHVYTSSMMVAVSIPLTANSVNIPRAIGAIASAGAAIATGGSSEVVSALALAAGVVNTMDALNPSSSMITGSSGSFAIYQQAPHLINTFIDVAAENSDAGRPLMADRKISDIPGFVQIPDPHFAIPATDTELAAINATAVSGFFYE